MLATLVRGLLRARRRENLLILLVFSGSLVGLAGGVMISEGAREAVAEPFRDVVTGDTRVTEGDTGLAQGDEIDYRSTEVRWEANGTLEVLPRVETNYVATYPNDPSNWSAGLLLGVDPGDPVEQAHLGKYLVAGGYFEGGDATDPETGEVYAPLLVGEPAARRLGIAENDTLPDFDDELIVSSGRVSGQGTLPITVRAVVVGVYETGVTPLDKFGAATTLRWARTLEGTGPATPTADALVVHGPEDQIQGNADASGYETVTPENFARDFVGGPLDILLGLALVQGGILVGLLLVWLRSTVDQRVEAEAGQIASLRAAGIDGASLATAYAALFGALLLAAGLVGGLAAVGLSLLAPPLDLAILGLEARIPWRLTPATFATIGALTAAGLALTTWTARERVLDVDVLDNLQAR